MFRNWQKVKDNGTGKGIGLCRGKAHWRDGRNTFGSAALLEPTRGLFVGMLRKLALRTSNNVEARRGETSVLQKQSHVPCGVDRGDHPAHIFVRSTLLRRLENLL